MTCHNLDFGRTVLDLVACGCSSSASFERYSVRNYTPQANYKGCSRGHGARKLVHSRWDRTRCRVSSVKTSDTLFNGKSTVLVLVWIVLFLFIQSRRLPC